MGLQKLMNESLFVAELRDDVAEHEKDLLMNPPSCSLLLVALDWKPFLWPVKSTRLI